MLGYATKVVYVTVNLVLPMIFTKKNSMCIQLIHARRLYILKHNQNLTHLFDRQQVAYFHIVHSLRDIMLQPKTNGDGLCGFDQ